MTVTPVDLERVRRALADVPALVDDLELTVTRQGAGLRARRPEGHALPLPFLDGPKIAEARRCVEILRRWARHVGGDGLNVRSSALALLAAGEWFRTDEQATTAAREILQIRAALRRAVERPPARTVYAGPCLAEVTTLAVDVDDQGERLTPRLEVETCYGDVLAEPGDPLALCRECRVYHHVAERHAFTLGAAVEAELLPLREILAALPALIGRGPNPDTVRQWRHRGRLQPVPGPWAGAELYRVDDVLRLARDAEARPGPRRRDLAAS